MKQTEVVIIGGGATGAGILRDLSMRGIKCILLEQGGLAHGTSSRFHGLLHSGGRYVVNDNESANECIEENYILRKVAKQCVELTEGFFALTKHDDPDFVKLWEQGCADAHIPYEEISTEEAFRLEPNLSRDITRVFKVPDSGIDGFRLVWHNVDSAKKYGGEYITHAQVTGLKVENGKVKGVDVLNLTNGEKFEIYCDYVVNATGSWAIEIAQMAGLKLPLVPDKGTLIIFNHRITSRVVNRLHKSSDGDIFVPHGSVTILGTTSAEAASPGDTKPVGADVIKLMEIGEKLFPDVYDYRILRAFAGTRPLYIKEGAEGRSATRNFTIIDHAEDGLEGMASIFGGKLTTYRLMAEKMSDFVATKFGNTTPCQTAITPITPDPMPSAYEKAKKVFNIEAVDIVADRIGDGFEKLVDEMTLTKYDNEVICECELVSLAEIKHVAADPHTHYLNDIRLRTRLGMGTCQGTFCSIRAIAALENETDTASKSFDNIAKFLQERWNGLRSVIWGTQAKEAELTRAIYISGLNFDGENDDY